MDVIFSPDPNLGERDLHVVVSARTLTPEAARLVAMLNSQGSSEKTTARSRSITVKTGESLELIDPRSIVFVELRNSLLHVVAAGKTVDAKETLGSFLERANDAGLVQVSRQAALSLRFLDSLRPSYSGNLTAVMRGGSSLDVSRRYVTVLRSALGLENS